jgi:hypothetical protein
MIDQIALDPLQLHCTSDVQLDAHTRYVALSGCSQGCAAFAMPEQLIFIEPRQRAAFDFMQAAVAGLSQGVTAGGPTEMEFSC